MLQRCARAYVPDRSRWAVEGVARAMKLRPSMKLYYAPGACSLAPHIVLRETGRRFDLESVDLGTHRTETGGDFMLVNPKGYVPALRLPDGEVLTEGAVIINYIADQFPDARLAPKHGTRDRYRANETVHFIATELHKGMAPMFNVLAGADYKTQLEERLHKRFQMLASLVGDKPFLGGDDFSIADGYAFYVMRAWLRSVHKELRSPTLEDYYARLAKRASVAAALSAEGIAA